MKKYKLRELCKDIIVPMRDKPKEFNGSIPWCRIEDITGKYLNGTKSNQYVSDTTINEMNLKVMPIGTVICSCSATLGVQAITTVECCTNQTFIGLNCGEKLNNEYLYYFLNPLKSFFENLGSGTTIKYISREKFENITLDLPILSIQQKIAEVLSSLDDKIALNNRINAKLEAMAKRLYDYWFVQFDFPNEEGKPYKSSGGKMVYNEVLKREIPAGWEVKKLGDVFTIVLGGTPSTETDKYWDEGTVNWLNSGEVAEFPIISSEKKITEEAIENSSTEFLKAGSVTLSITRYLRPSILAMDACINQSVIGIKENDRYTYSFIYPFLINDVSRLMSLRTGAQQPHINKEIVQSSFICLPSEEVLASYYTKANSLYQTIIGKAKESAHLTALRDKLLPLLMNGQVEVK